MLGSMTSHTKKYFIHSVGINDGFHIKAYNKGNLQDDL